MVSAGFIGLVAVQLFFSRVAARPRCHPLPVFSSLSSSESLSSTTVTTPPTSSVESSSEFSTTISETTTSSVFLELSSTTESVASTTITTSSILSSDSIGLTTSSLVTPTSSSEFLPSSTVFLSSSTAEVSSTTTAPSCDPTPTYFPETCWASIPNACTALNRTPALAYATALQSATACRRAFSVGGAVATPVADCFPNLGSSQFNAARAYSCVSAAPLYCQSTTACGSGPSTTPTPMVSNGGFESGAMSSWVPVQMDTGPAGNAEVSVTNEKAHSGDYSLRLNYNNLAGAYARWVQDVKLVPGATYQVSFWWYSANNQATTSLIVGIEIGGVSTYVTRNTNGSGVSKEWVHQTVNVVVASVSVGQVFIYLGGSKGPGSNTIYVDDVELKML